jgi:hypothetical protein
VWADNIFMAVDPILLAHNSGKTHRAINHFGIGVPMDCMGTAIIPP